jgi:hypothetical protein
MKISKIAQFNNFEGQNEDPDFDLDFDPNIPNPMLDRIYHEIVPVITQVKTDACTTVYKVNRQKVKLWMVCDGAPALGLLHNDGLTEYHKRYPLVPKWSDTHWIKNEHRYEHQDINNIQGPTYDVLPNGAQDLIDFVQENTPKLQSRQARYQQLPAYGIVLGPKKLDKNTRSYSRPEIYLAQQGLIINVPKQNLYHPWWDKIFDFCNRHNPTDTINPRYSDIAYEDLSESEFQELIQLIHEGITANILQPGRN